MVQETLEEAAEKYDENNTNDEYGKSYRAFIEGVKWQQERSYSEDDLISLLEFNYKKETNQLGTLRKDYSQKIVREWFEQFKK